MVVSNNKALKVSPYDRRVFAPDVSAEKVGNVEYFNKLGEAIGSKNVGHAFFCFLKEHFTRFGPKFREATIPRTEHKHQLVNENIHHVFRFIKDEYLAKNTGINMRFSDFYGKFAIVNNNKTTKIDVSKNLQKLNMKL